MIFIVSSKLYANFMNEKKTQLSEKVLHLFKSPQIVGAVAPETQCSHQHGKLFTDSQKSGKGRQRSGVGMQSFL